MTGASKGAVTKLIADLGPVCAAYMDEHFHDLPCTTLEVDEIWAFCYAKAKNVPEEHRGEFGYGDVWTFTAIDADTKLIPTYIAFQGEVDFAMLQKIYAGTPGGEQRYSPAECIGCRKESISGDPDPRRVSTSYVERANLSIRMGLRRYTRLTNAHSKKLENHCAALAIFFMHYNFARVHSTVRCSPAMAAGVTSHLWSVEEIVSLLPVEVPKKRGPYKKRAA